MTGKVLQDLIKAQLSSVMTDHSGGTETWKQLPNTKCQVGYDGMKSLLRIPIDSGEATNWKTRNSLLRSRISISTNPYIYLSFDFDNADRLAPFLVELVTSVDESDEDSSEVLEELLNRWSGYWSETKPIFNKEDQIGTLGELLVLEKLLDLKPTLQTLETWKSPKMKDDLHDFEATKGNLEVKTSSSVPRSIYVGSINQMDHEIIHPKSLLIVLVKLNSGSEMTLPSVVERLRFRCSQLGISVVFDEMLKKRGYRDFEADVYAEQAFDLDAIEQHTVDLNTPIYTNRDINTVYPAVVRVKQIIDPTMVGFSPINSNEWTTIAENIGI